MDLDLKPSPIALLFVIVPLHIHIHALEYVSELERCRYLKSAKSRTGAQNNQDKDQI